MTPCGRGRLAGDSGAVRLSWVRLLSVALLLATLVLAAGLRCWHLDASPLWWDEGNNAYFAQLSLPDLARMSATTHDTNPPLHRWTLGPWLAIFGEGALQMRAYSVVCSLLTVLLVYAWGRWFGGERLGLLAALLYAVSPFAIYYGREAKGYAFVTLWVVLGSYVWRRWCLREKGRRLWGWVLYAFSGLMAAGAHYYALLAMLAQGLWQLGEQALHIHSRRHWRRTAYWLGAQAVVGLGLLAWLLPTWRASLAGATGLPEAGEPVDLLRYAWRTLCALAAGPYGPTWIAGVSLGLLALLIVAACWRRRSQRMIGFWLLMIVAPLAAGYLAQRLVPFQHARFFAYIMPFVCLLAAAGAQALGRLGSGVALALLVVWALALPTAWGPRVADAEDMRPLVREIESQGDPETPIVVSYIWQEGILRSYLSGACDYHLGWYGEEDVAEELGTLLHERGSLWHVTYRVPLQHPCNTGGWWLEHNAIRGVLREYGNGRAALYMPIPETRAGGQARFGHGLTLCYTPVRARVEPGTPIPLHLEWSLDAEHGIGAGHTVYVHLLNADGQVAAQTDGAPRNGLIPLASIEPGQPLVDGRAIMVPPDAPPGVYRLRVGVYDTTSGERLLCAADQADGVDLGEVEVLSR